MQNAKSQPSFWKPNACGLSKFKIIPRNMHMKCNKNFHSDRIFKIEAILKFGNSEIEELLFLSISQWIQRRRTSGFLSKIKRSQQPHITQIYTFDIGKHDCVRLLKQLQIAKARDGCILKLWRRGGGRAHLLELYIINIHILTV